MSGMTARRTLLTKKGAASPRPLFYRLLLPLIAHGAAAGAGYTSCLWFFGLLATSRKSSAALPTAQFCSPPPALSAMASVSVSLTSAGLFAARRLSAAAAPAAPPTDAAQAVLIERSFA